MCLRASSRRLFLFFFRSRKPLLLQAFDDTARRSERPPELTIILYRLPCTAPLNSLPYPVGQDGPAPKRTSMNFDVARTQMLGQQLRAWSVLNDRVLNAFRHTPREFFVPSELRDLAFADAEIPLGHGQSMLSPKVEGRVLQALDIEPIENVLVVGTGSGYLTACIASLAKHVVSIDIFPDFVADAEAKLRDHDIRNVELAVADATALDYAAQFDAIAVTASVPTFDEHFVRMLRPRGRLFIVVGDPPAMEARLVTLSPGGGTTSESLFETVLTPMINAARPAPFVL